MTIMLESPHANQGVTLSGVSWAYYEHTLSEICRGQARVTFLDGVLEIMSSLPEHETAKTAICGLIETLTLVLNLPQKSFGSTTFRREDTSAGAEPDACYYFTNIDRVRGMKRFDPLIHPAPDLAIEIDLLSPSIPREPIYARLGVPEIWRYNLTRLSVHCLRSDNTYGEVAASGIFPFLPIAPFTAFIRRMIDEDETMVRSDFRDWLLTVEV
jgi:Uma2 family endonuclease